MTYEGFMTMARHIQVTQGDESANCRQHRAVWLSAPAVLQAKGPERLTEATPDKAHPET